MENEDKITIAMLDNLIANIKAGNITTLDRGGYQISPTVAKITLQMTGEPDASLTSENS